MTKSDGAIAAGKASLKLSLQSVLNLGMGAAFFTIYSRVLSKPDLGILATLTLTYTVFQYIGQLGLNRSAPSLVANALVEGERPARQVIWGIITLAAIGSSLAMVGAFALSSRLSEWLLGTIDQTYAFQVTALVVLTNAFSYVCDGLMQGIRDYSRLAYSGVAGQIVRIAVSLILLVRGYGVLALIIGALFGLDGIISILLQSPAILRRFRIMLPTARELYQILRYSIPLQGVTILLMTSTQLDLAIVVANLPISQVGVYSVALTVAQFMSLAILLPINAALIPFMSKIMKETGTLEGAFTRASRYMSIVVVPCAIALASASELLVTIVAGTRYSDAALPLAAILLATIPQAYSLLVSATLQAHGRNNAILKAIAGGVALEAVVGILIVPKFGLLAAALSRLALYVTWFLISALQLRMFMPLRFERGTLIRISIASCAFLIIVFLEVPLSRPFGMLVSVLVAIVLFLGLLRLFHALTPHDVQILVGILPSSVTSIIRITGIQKLADWVARESI